MRRPTLTKPRILLLLLISLLPLCALAQEDAPLTEVVISVSQQQLAIVRAGEVVGRYPVSTSKFGLGDARGSYKTPLGRLRVCDKIGDDLVSGTVLKGRETTGEVLAVNAPGRDPIVTRILWLEGTEEQNRNARARAIYIHGTPEENRIGDPVSWGCIRMRSKDVIALFEQVEVGTPVTIVPERLPKFRKHEPSNVSTFVMHRPTEMERTAPASIVRATETSPGTNLAPASQEPPTFTGKGKAAAFDAMKGSILFSGIAESSSE